MKENDDVNDFLMDEPVKKKEEQPIEEWNSSDILSLDQKNENQVYGRLTESVHIAGYSLERAMGEFKWLLEEDRWKKVGSGYNDINDFVKSVKFSEFKISIEQRKDISKLLAEKEVSQRSTAKMLGYSQGTIQKDIDQNNSLDKKAIKPIDTGNGLKTDIDQNNSPDEIPYWIRDNGQKLAYNVKRIDEKNTKYKKEKNKVIDEGSKVIITNDLIDIRLGDFKKVLDDIPDNSIDLILTDPPYPYEYIDCWTELGIFAQSKLKDGGFLIAYSGHIHLPEVINRVLESGIKWYWLGSCLHTGHGLSQVFEVNMLAKHKPILFFYKGNKHKQSNWTVDVFESKDEETKEFHKWGQTVDIFDKLIKIFEPKIVVDPFLGGATTAIACLMNNVKFIGAEINDDDYNISKKRIDDYEK